MLSQRFTLYQAYDRRKVASSLKPKAHIFLEPSTRLLTREQVEHLCYIRGQFSAVEPG